GLAGGRGASRAAGDVRDDERRAPARRDAGRGARGARERAGPCLRPPAPADARRAAHGAGTARRPDRRASADPPPAALPARLVGTDARRRLLAGPPDRPA